MSYVVSEVYEVFIAVVTVVLLASPVHRRS